MRGFRIVLTMWLLAPFAPLHAEEYGPEPDAATRAEILELREAAWRTWFGNDQAGFRRVVPEELVAMGWTGGAWEDREQTLRTMAEFAKGGQALRSLEFPRNVFQQYGDVVILYTSFRLVLADAAGKEQEVAGRGTEVFVRRDGRWIHTGWHLDAVAG
jgi:ketosteroid isomerase-like protein